MIIKIIKSVTLVCLVPVLLLFGVSFIGTSRVPPDNIQVYIDKENKTFITPPCVSPSQKNELSKLEHYPKNNVPEKYKSYVAAGDCTWDSLQANSNLTKDILLFFGYGTDPMSRWDSDGNWNW